MSGESESEESYASAEESELSDGAEEHCGLTIEFGREQRQQPGRLEP